MAMERTIPDDRYAVLVTLSVRADSAQAAAARIEHNEWVKELSGAPTKVTPIFASLKEGVIEQTRVVGAVPQFDDASTNLTTTLLMFDVYCWIIGTARSVNAFRTYMLSGWWFVEGTATVTRMSLAFPERDVDVSRYTL